MSRTDALVSADWAEQNLNTDGVVLVEVDEDTSAYDGGHIAGAVKLDWKTELQDQVRRDFVSKEQFEELLSQKGIGNDDTVVLYGGNNNWFAAYAYWYFKLYGHGRRSSCSTADARSGNSTAASCRKDDRDPPDKPTYQAHRAGLHDPRVPR